MINYQFLLIPDFGDLTHYGNGMLQYVKNEKREIQSVWISLQQDVSDVLKSAFHEDSKTSMKLKTNSSTGGPHDVH